MTARWSCVAKTAGLLICQLSLSKSAANSASRGAGVFGRALIMLLVLFVRRLGLFLSGGAVAALERLAPCLKQPSPKLLLSCATAGVSVKTDRRRFNSKQCTHQAPRRARRPARPPPPDGSRVRVSAPRRAQLRRVRTARVIVSPAAAISSSEVSHSPRAAPAEAAASCAATLCMSAPARAAPPTRGSPASARDTA